MWQGEKPSTSKNALTFMAPLVAMALRDNPVMNVQQQHIDTSIKLCQTPAIPTILQEKI
jgi:hypothetical protein